MSPDEPLIVATDASVLINLAIIDRFALLGALHGLRFVAPDAALAEVRYEPQQARLKRALERRHLHEAACNEPAVLDRLTLFRRQMGHGEAACLALAVEKGWLFACDEGGLVRRKATNLLGPNRLLNTPGLCLLGIRQRYWTLEEADAAKKLLEENRFTMTFGSFGDLL